MILVIGEILFDEFPQGKRPGGAPFNVAQHLARLGLDVQFVSRVGCDEAGDELIAIAEKSGLDPSLIQRDPDHPTGRVAVTVDDQGVPSYDIVADVAYDHIDFNDLPKIAVTAQLLYFGSLIQRTGASRERLQRFLADIPYGIIHFYDMNLREGCDRSDVVLPSLEHTDVLKLNEDELAVAGRLIGSEKSGDELVAELMERFSLKQVALTCGPNGSKLYDLGMSYEEPAGLTDPDQIVDTVGAGDAFSSVLAWAFQNGFAPADALRRANRLAERVCTISGAVPQDDSFYDDV